MKPSNKILLVVAAIVFTASLPLAAFVLIERVPYNQRVRVSQGNSFRTTVTLTQPAMGDGSVRLQPGVYSVDIASMGDGSVRGSFFDKSGHKVGEAHGIIVVAKNTSAVQASALPAVQSNAKGKTSNARTATPPAPAFSGGVTFASVGLLPTSKSSFSQANGKMNLEISSADGTNQILIGLLLPAVMPSAGH